jgi:hypothetical protein
VLPSERRERGKRFSFGVREAEQMKFLSAYEDYLRNTLPCLAGILDRLTFTAGLRGAEEEHWGLTRVHGREAAQKAVAQAHQELTAAVITAPFEDLSAEFDRIEQVAQAQPGSGLAAPESPVLSKKHLNWVLRVLSAASRRSHASTDQASSQ